MKNEKHEHFEAMWALYRLGLHETGYIIYGNPFLSVKSMATLNTVILPIIRRVMPTVIANEIIGTQSMTGPVGQIHTLRTRYKCSK